MSYKTLYMLDTNTASYIIKGNSVAIRKKLLGLPTANICISSITECELLYGIAKKPEAKKLHINVNEFLQKVEILPWDSSAANTYAELRNNCEKEGKSLGSMDMLIASHSKSYGAVLVTNDKAFYNIEHLLMLEDWTKTIN